MIVSRAHLLYTTNAFTYMSQSCWNAKPAAATTKIIKNSHKNENENGNENENDVQQKKLLESH